VLLTSSWFRKVLVLAFLAVGLVGTPVAGAMTLVERSVLEAGRNGASGRAAGAGCTIVGTPGPDSIVGTPRHDVICALGGNDVVHGRGGNDVI
jgi:hypothetical protein